MNGIKIQVNYRVDQQNEPVEIINKKIDDMMKKIGAKLYHSGNDNLIEFRIYEREMDEDNLVN